MKRKMAKSLENSAKFINYNDKEKYYRAKLSLFSNYMLKNLNLNENNKTQIGISHPFKKKSSNSTNHNSMIQNYNSSKQNKNIKRRVIYIKNKSCEMFSTPVAKTNNNKKKIFLKKMQKININSILNNNTNLNDIKKYGLILNEHKNLKDLNKTADNNIKHRYKTVKLTTKVNHVTDIRDEKIKIRNKLKNEENEKLCIEIIKLIKNPESFLYSFYNTMTKKYYYNPESQKIDYKKRFDDYKSYLSKYEEKEKLKLLNLKNNRMVGQDVNIKGNFISNNTFFG